MNRTNGKNFMHKLCLLTFSLLCLLYYMAPNLVYAGFDQLIPQRQRGKFFTPQIRLRAAYDDNVSHKRGTDGTRRGFNNQQIKSMINYVEPKIMIRLPLDQTYIGFDYKFSLAYFWARPYDNEDVAHDINFRFKHNFSPRLTFDLSDDYIHQQEGTIKREHRVISGKGDFERNKLNTVLKYDIFRSLYITAKYGLEFLDFRTRSASETFDYIENMIGFDTGYVLNKDTLLLFGYTFRDHQYDLRENADYDSHLLFSGVNYRLGKYFSLDALAGVDFRKHEAPTRGALAIDFDAVPLMPSYGVPFDDVFVPGKRGTTKTGKNPYVDIRLTTNYFRNAVITVGYLYTTLTTEQEDFQEATTQSASLQVSYRILPKITIDLNMMYAFEDYDGTAYNYVTADNSAGTIGKIIVLDHPETKTFRMGAVVSYQVTPWLFYEAGYRRTDVDSDFNTSTWEQNVLFTGINAIF